jgi:hypothetical protein
MSQPEVKCLTMESRELKYFCDSCDEDLSELLELNELVSSLNERNRSIY